MNTIKNTIVTASLLIGLSFSALANTERERFVYIDDDYKAEFKNLESLALGGDREAQNAVGWMYKEGEGVDQSYEKSIYWLQKSAIQGDPVAQYNLGSMYERGIGVAENDKIAFKWHLMAARQGDLDSQNRLGALVVKIDKQKNK